ncbi:MAG: hypothetical protein M9928_15565 [Anaerolineae bacterium]|nr:hypothetical protein [Anaerolineae bacterium]MCO5194569.1 hypothetical protein [Anaerolineae bacterium]MCO5199643.1 hypothetical protein [Anaerolineae bacterium]MCO5206454.1 hypothetical protein [Anaerolineae bacterium]
MNLLRYTVRTIIILLVLLSALAVGVALGSMNVPAASIYPTPGAPPHIMASIAPVLPTPAIHVATWTPEAVAPADFALPTATNIVISAEVSPPPLGEPVDLESRSAGSPSGITPTASPVSDAAVIEVHDSADFSVTDTVKPSGEFQHATETNDITFSGNNLQSAESLFSFPQELNTPVPDPGPAPTFTPLPPTPTSTPVPPTLTPTPLPTATATPQPTSTPIGYIKCDLSAHDVTVLHGLYDEVDDCWNDHFHVHGNGISNDFMALIGGEFPYQWVTSPTENVLYPAGKHEGFNFSSRSADYMHCATPPYCVDSFDILWHGIAANKGMATRFHSFAARYQIGEGFVFFAGWMDCGQEIDLNDTKVTIDTSRPQPGSHAEKHETYAENKSQTWYCTLPDLGVENTFSQQYAPVLGPSTPENIFGSLHAICEDDDVDCLARGHDRWIASIVFDLDRPWLGWLDEDGNGVAEFNGFVDRYGMQRVEGECVAIALDCIPFIVSNVPVGRYEMNTNPTGSDGWPQHFERINFWNRQLEDGVD